MIPFRPRRSAVHFSSAAFLLGFALVAAAPATAADVAHGGIIAGRWCAACHVVSPDQKRASTDVPGFADIARRRGNGDLTTFLIDPHPKMPDMSLSRDEIADLVAYIRSRADDK
jgi:mono/diheme cytochrome c family protein